jgi:multidrug resistance efflux pump
MRRTFALAIPLLLSACGRPADDGTYAGTIELADVEVGSLVGGRVARVLKAEGERASAGELLVELDPAEWQSALEEAGALAQATERELDLLVAGPREEEIAEARAVARRLELLWEVSRQGARPEEVEAARQNVQELEARARDAEQEVTRIANVTRSGAEPMRRLEQATAERDGALARLEMGRQRLQLLEKGLRPEEIEAAKQAYVAQQQRVKALEAGARPEEVAAKRAVLEAAKARIGVAKSRLAELRILAPGPCYVQTLDVRPGDMLRAGTPVATLLLEEQPWIVVYVPEGDLARVSVGQAASVTPDGLGALEGKVTWISRRAEYTPRNVQTRGERVTQVFAVKVTVPAGPAALKDGMWADVRFR